MKRKKIERRKVILTLLSILIFISVYLVDYFFDRYTLRNPVAPREMPVEAVSTPTPTPTPIEEVKDTGGQITTGPESYIIDKIYQVFGEEDGPVAVAVAKAESGLRYNAVSYSGCCHGIFQIHTVHQAKYEGRDIEDVNTNIEVAKEIYDAQGWGPWEVYTNGAYLAHL